jgi:hypothetical protein
MAQTAAGTVRPTATEAALVRGLLEQGGIRAQQATGLTRHSLARIAAGLPVRQGTLGMLRGALAILPTEGEGQGQ